MKQFLYLALLMIGFQAAASNDSSLTVIHRTVNGGTVKKEMGDRVYMKTNSNKVYAIKCVKNPKVVCAYVAKATEDVEEPELCPAISMFIPEPYYSMQFNPEKAYVGIPNSQGGITYHEVHSAEINCTTAEAEETILITLDPPLDLEGE
jgi:uncharacterized protein YuzE